MEELRLPRSRAKGEIDLEMQANLDYSIFSRHRPLLIRSDAGNFDRLVIQDILKEIAQTQQVDVNAKHRFKGERERESSTR